MTGHRRLLLLAAAALCLTLATAAPQAVREETEYLGLLTRADKLNAGNLHCDAGELQFQVYDQELYDLAFSDQVAPPGAFIEYVQMGAANTPGCRAPRFDLRKYHAIVLSYRLCQFSSAQNGATITHANQATVSVRLPSPSGVVRRKLFKIPLRCVGSSQTQSPAVHTQYWPQIQYLDGHEGNFSVTVSAKIRKVHRVSFLGEEDIFVNVITVELDHPNEDNYDIVSHRCWATPTADRADPAAYEFISPRGRANDSYQVTVSTDRTDRYVYELKEFAFEGEDEIALPDQYFHCDVNVCYKGVDSGDLCTPSLAGPGLRAAATAANRPFAFAVGSPVAKALRHTTLIGSNGRPVPKPK